MGLNIKRMKDLKKKPLENEFEMNDDTTKKVLSFRDDHPFLEISGATYNNEVIFEIGLRPTLRVDDEFVSDKMEQVRVIGVLPDYSMALGKKIHPTIQRLCQDHMMGTSMNQFLKRLNWKNTANIENMILFPKLEDGTISSMIDFRRLTLFFELILNSFIMLECSTQGFHNEQKNDNEIALYIKSRGSWTTHDHQLLPKLRGLGLAFSQNRLADEFERFYSEMKSTELANHAVKEQIMTTIASELYKMEFDGEVDKDLIQGSHRKLNILPEPVTLKELLKYQVERQKLVDAGGDEIKK